MKGERPTQAYDEFFEAITGNAPYPYQQALGDKPWPEMLEIPTGLGKTAAIVAAWLWKRLQGDSETPRRLVYCLPMRVLVQQTWENAVEWTLAARPFFDDADRELPDVAVLMGGDVQLDWVENPERPSILVGTQDMLVSRALNRGYGMSPFQWPVHFALLHNDAFWVYDEVQLMGSAVATSAQLEAFRRSLGTAAPCRSLWASATLDRRWLRTVDLEEQAEDFRVHAISSRDRGVDRVASLLHASKRLHRAATALDRTSGKKNAAPYLEALSAEILERHREGTDTLVILNRVERAQELYRRLREGVEEDGPDPLLIHGRFRPFERRDVEARLKEAPSAPGRIIVSTQVVEAGVDLTSATLFTELCPWPSFVQRCGRCNRYAEVEEGATVLWIDVEEGEKDLELPYEASELASARDVLLGLDDVGLDRLPRFEGEPWSGLVLRRRDLLELFNSDPDLFGFHVDVSRYVRDTDDRSLQVFWRDVPDGQAPPPDLPAPVRDELCSAAISAVGTTVQGNRRAWEWDAQSGGWRSVRRDQIRPGMTLLLAQGEGAYDPKLGFAPEVRARVPDVPGTSAKEGGDGSLDSMPSDSGSRSRNWVPLTDHLDHVAQAVSALAEGLGVPPEERDALVTAARWHDVGKAHGVFQADLLSKVPEGDPLRENLWAKSGPTPATGGTTDSRSDEERSRRRYFRHELASALAWLTHRSDHPARDLIAYLIAAHHGKVRTSLRSLPAEPRSDEGQRYARGVWEGDRLPPLDLPEEGVPETELRLELMELGEGPQGPSWSARVQDLLRGLGPFRLAWLEALLRIADWRASAAEAWEETP
ncbi:MAG: CRISPR-associated endonuclease Cas3'' [Thermoanaerobaculia bacterium]